MVDLTGIYRIWNPKYNSYSVFSQDHLAKVLLGWDTAGAAHNAVSLSAHSPLICATHQPQLPDLMEALNFKAAEANSS